MTFKDDVADALSDEVLTEMAESFFGERIHLDNLLALLEEYVETLHRKAAHIEDHARFLNRLLLEEKHMAHFYEAIGMATIPFPKDAAFSEERLPERVPRALTARGEYLKLVSRAYETLQKSVEDYMNGNQNTGESRRTEDEDAYYSLVRSMVALINAEIRKVNKNRSPGDVLQSAHRFRSNDTDKAIITGGDSFYGDSSSFSRSLYYDPVDFDTLKLRRFPVPPPHSRVNSRIENFCTRLYYRNEGKVKSLIDRLKAEIRSRS